MLGFEQNADVVHASSFAPLFANTNYEGWVYNLVQFNATASFQIPGWYAQVMLIDAVRVCGGRGRASPPGVHSARAGGDPWDAKRTGWAGWRGGRR